MEGTILPVLDRDSSPSLVLRAGRGSNCTQAGEKHALAL